MEFVELYDALIDAGYFAEGELQLVCNVAGDTIETLDNCVYARYGYRDAAEFVTDGEDF